MKLHLPKQLFTALLAAISLSSVANALTVDEGTFEWTSFETSPTAGENGETVTYKLSGGQTMQYTATASNGNLTLGSGLTSIELKFDLAYTAATSGTPFITLNWNNATSWGIGVKVDGDNKYAAGWWNGALRTADTNTLASFDTNSNGTLESVTASFGATSGTSLTSSGGVAGDILTDSGLKSSSAQMTGVTLDSSIVKKIHYYGQVSETGFTVTNSDKNISLYYDTVSTNNVSETAVEATVITGSSLTITPGQSNSTYNTFKANAGDIIVGGGAAQLYLQTWYSDNIRTGNDIDLSKHDIYLGSSTNGTGALRLGAWSGDITLGKVILIEDTSLDKEADVNNHTLTIGSLEGDYTLNIKKIDTTTITGKVDVKGITTSGLSSITFNGETAIDNLTINANTSFSFNGTTTIGSATIASNKTLTMGSSHTINYRVSGEGVLIVENGVTLTLDNGNNAYANSKSFAANLRIKDGGRMVVSGTNFSDQFDYDQRRTVYLEGSAELALGNTRQTVGNWTFDMTGGTISGQGQSGNLFALDFHNTGFIKAHAAADATAENPTVSTVSASIKIRDNGQLNLVADENARLNLTGELNLAKPVEKSGAGLAVISGKVTSLGAVNVTGGTLELQSSARTASAISVSSGAELEISAGTSTLSGAVTNNGAITVSGGTATISGAVTNSGAITVSGGTADFTSTLDMGAGSTLSVSSGSATVSGTLNVTGTDVQITQSGTGALNLAGSLNIGEGATLTLGGSVGIGSLTAASGSVLNLAENAVLGKIATIDGTVTLAGSGTYDLEEVNNEFNGSTLEDQFHVSLGENWTGVIKVAGYTNATDLSALGNGKSWAELAGVRGYFSDARSQKEYDINLILTNGSVTKNNATYMTAYAQDNGWEGDNRIITGSVKGSGNWGRIEGTGTHQTWEFAGDVSQWTGKIFNGAGSANNKITETTYKFTGDGADGAAMKLDVEIKNHNITATGEYNENANTGYLFIELDNTNGFDVNKDIEATKLTVHNSTAKLTGEGNSVSVGGVTISKQNAEMRNVTVQGSSIAATSTVNGAKGSISDALIQLATDASFTIEDMTLTNTTVTAATVDTTVNLSNVSVGADSLVTLAKGAFTVQDQANVAMGGSACNFTTSSYSGLVLGAAGEASITLNLGDLSQLTPMGPGVYDFSILLDGFQMTGDNASVLFAADSWLGKLLAQSNNANVEISISQAADAGEAAAAGAATGVSYSTGSVGTIITINGLNVPEPTTATLSLLALAGLCARRRRND